MLELRPTRECCNKPLRRDSVEARICTYECTFYATCVDTLITDKLDRDFLLSNKVGMFILETNKGFR